MDFGLRLRWTRPHRANDPSLIHMVAMEVSNFRRPLRSDAVEALGSFFLSRRLGDGNISNVHSSANCKTRPQCAWMPTVWQRYSGP